MISLYVGNAAAMWSSLVPGATVTDGILRADEPTATRLLVLRPSPASVVAAQVDAVPAHRSVTLENAFVEPDDPLAIMVRPPGPLPSPPLDGVRVTAVTDPPGPLPSPPAGGVRVTRVTDPEELAAAERVIVDGFPLPRLQPLVRGRAMPPHILDRPGWRVWLAYRGDEPGAAVYTYDDGQSLGVYRLATMPSMRSAGLGRAIMAVALASAATRPATLVATRAGRPLYDKLGFTQVGTTLWQTRPAIAIE